MKIASYISSLLPTFSRSQVEEDIRMLKKELTESTLPPFTNAAEFFSNNPFQAKAVKDYDRYFQQHCRPIRASGNWVTVTRIALERTNDTLDWVNTAITKEFGRDITADGMTFLRANLLRYIEVVNFALRYSRTVLLWALGEEDIQGRGRSVTKAEYSWMLANRDAYLRTIQILTTPVEEVKKYFQNIPNMVIVPEEIEVSEFAVGATRLDPLNMGLLPINLNPIYHVRMAITEWQVDRIKAAEREAQALEYRLQALRELREEGKRDARLEATIDYHEGRLQKIKRRIAEYYEEPITGQAS